MQSLPLLETTLKKCAFLALMSAQKKLLPWSFFSFPKGRSTLGYEITIEIIKSKLMKFLFSFSSRSRRSILKVYEKKHLIQSPFYHFIFNFLYYRWRPSCGHTHRQKIVVAIDEEVEEKLSISVLRSWSAIFRLFSPLAATTAGACKIISCTSVDAVFFLSLPYTKVISRIHTRWCQEQRNSDVGKKKRTTMCTCGYYDLCWHLHLNYFFLSAAMLCVLSLMTSFR